MVLASFPPGRPWGIGGSDVIEDKPPLESLSIHLFKGSVEVLGECLDEEKQPELVELELSPSLPFDGLAFYRPSEPSQPAWAPFLRQGLLEEPPLRSSSVSAVLLLRAENRIFAVPWGPAGRFFLDRALTVDDFGLKVALNSIDPEKVRSTDSREIDEASKQKREQASHVLNFDEFDFDASRAILQAVTGKPRDPTLAKRITGKGHIRVDAHLTLTDLGDTCARLLERYEADDYKESFPWLDSLRHIKEAEEIERLDEVLLSHLRDLDLEHAHLAPPEIVNWDELQWFVYPRAREAKPENRVEDLDIEACLRAVRAPQDLERGDLNQGPRVKWSDRADTHKPWSIYEMLVFECTHEGESYVLSSGKWFRVETDYVEEIDQKLSNLETSALPLPDAWDGEHEGNYNARAANGQPDWILMDGKDCKPSGYVSPIEVCDILTPEQDFVHIKRYSGSQTLSHLLAQGRVSAEAFLADASFRTQARNIAMEVHPASAAGIPWDDPKSQGITVVYGIVVPPSKQEPTDLPFFAKVNFTHTLRTMTPMECDVEFAAIQIQEDNGAASDA